MNNTLKNLILTSLSILYQITYCIKSRIELKLLYRLKMGTRSNLNNPVTYNEKM